MIDISNQKYAEEIKSFCFSNNFQFLKNKTLLITGATGLIGSYLIDVLLYDKSFDVKLLVTTRKKENIEKRFPQYINDERLHIIECDLCKENNFDLECDYVIHLASFSDAKNYATFPVETMLMNFNGCKNLLDLAKKCKCEKFFFASSSEIYGTSVDAMIETNYGLVNPLDIRSCYNESKRASETLCISYKEEFGVNVVIGRFCRVYGPTMLMEDTKALSQFLKNGLESKNIILKSAGNQKYSYIYVSDAVSGILKLLENGLNGEAYNISNDTDIISLKEIATSVANLSNVRVEYDLPKDFEVKGYSRVQNAILPSEKLMKLGWTPQVSLIEGLERTFNILKN